ncbi:MAG: hypothetical protein WDN06_04485 [Asticcacaulis sp.]
MPNTACYPMWAPEFRVKTRNGRPTPDDLDELIARVWKQPAFFLAHPKAIAAFGRECTRRGVPPPTVSIYGSPFLTWRGIPLVPSDKVKIENGKSKILLLRTGQARQGVIGLYPAQSSRRTKPRPVGAFHGHQQQGDLVLPDLALLFARRPDQRCAGRSGRRGSGSVPCLYLRLRPPVIRRTWPGWRRWRNRCSRPCRPAR